MLNVDDCEGRAEKTHAIMAQVFCRGCGWMLKLGPDLLLACWNPKCEDQHTKFKLQIELTEVEEATHWA